jgi:hypothetical protein
LTSDDEEGGERAGEVANDHSAVEVEGERSVDRRKFKRRVAEVVGEDAVGSTELEVSFDCWKEGDWRKTMNLHRKPFPPLDRDADVRQDAAPHDRLRTAWTKDRRWIVVAERLEVRGEVEEVGLRRFIADLAFANDAVEKKKAGDVRC